MKQADFKRLGKPATLMAALAMAFSLAACNKQADDGQTVGQRVDSAIGDAKVAADNAKQEAREASRDIRSETKAATADATDKVADAAITASVNADLAKDPDLSALKVNVDTSNGRVLLRGTAPTEDAKERASRLAANVKGVTSVENELSVQR